MLLNASTGAAWLFCVMLATILFQSWPAILLAFVLGMVVLNYQYLVTLPRIMDPILALPANAGRRNCYEYVVGRKAIVLSSLLAIGALLFAMARRGLI